MAGDHEVLEALRRALDAETHVLQREPDALWPQLHNRLQWDPAGAGLAADEAAHRSSPWLRTLSTSGATGGALRTIPTHGRVAACRFTPDGSALVVAEGRTVTVRDLTGAVRFQLEMAGVVADCAVAGSTIAALGEDGVASTWDRSGRLLASWPAVEADELPGRTCALTPEGTLLVTGGGHAESSEGDDVANGVMTVWDTVTGTRRRSLVGHLEPARACTVLPDGRRVLSTGSDGSLRVHDLLTGDGRLVAWVGDTGLGCAAHPGEAFYCVAGYMGAVTVWNPATGERQARLEGHDRWAMACAVSPDGAYFVSTGYDGTVRLWDPLGRQEATVLLGHTGAVSCCDVSPDGKLIASGGADATVRLWSATAAGRDAGVRGHVDRVRGCAVSGDGAWVATAGADGTIGVWELPEGTPRMMIHSTDSQYGVAALPDGSGLVTVDQNGGVAVWDVDDVHSAGRFDRPRCHAIRPCGNRGWSCTTAPDGSWVAAVGEQLAVLDPASAEVVRTHRDLGGRAVSAPSPELLVASLGGVRRPSGAPTEAVVLQVLDARTGERLVSMEAEAGVIVNDVATAPSGHLVAAACNDWTLRLWAIGGGAPVALLRVRVGAGLEEDLLGLALSFTGAGERAGLTGCRFLDDDHIVTTGFDGSVRLWDLTGTTAPAVAFLPHPVLAVDVWPPSRVIVCGDSAGGLHRMVAERL